LTSAFAVNLPVISMFVNFLVNYFCFAFLSSLLFICDFFQKKKGKKKANHGARQRTIGNGISAEG